MKLELPYGRRPYPLDVGARDVRVVAAAELPAPAPVEELLEQALDSGKHLSARAGSRVTVILSDPSRAEPRAAFVAALRRRLPGVRWTFAIATGTHGPCNLADLGVDLAGETVVNHDGHRGDDLVELGTTARGTPVRLHRCVVEADLVIATGCIRPHYFAGFGAGVKAIFPGLGEATAVRINHRLKTESGARAGIVDGNPCREDLEEAVAMVPTPTFLVNGVVGPDARVHAVVAGDLVDAFRRGVAIARPWFTVRAPRAATIVASDALPVTTSLYQAAKIAAAAAPLLAENGTLVIAAECPDGTGPLDTVNEAIFRIGVLPRLPSSARLVLVSGLAPDLVARTLCTYAASVDAALEPTSGPVLVIPKASQLICEPLS